MHCLLILVLVATLAQTEAYRHESPLVKGSARIWSRHARGKASMVKIPKEEKLSVQDFWAQHVDAWGLESHGQMVYSHSRSASGGGPAGGGVVYEHHIQVLLGR
jgi:hypothetical protein